VKKEGSSMMISRHNAAGQWGRQQCHNKKNVCQCVWLNWGVADLGVLELLVKWEVKRGYNGNTFYDQKVLLKKRKGVDVLGVENAGLSCIK